MWYNDGMSFIKRNWRTLLFGIIGGAVGVVFFNILWGDPNLAVAIVAFGTLMLALATALNIINSNEQEKRRREEELSKEKRDKDERLLNEIIEWVINVLKLNSDLLSFTESVRLNISLVSTQTQDELYSNTMGLRDRGKYIKITANVAGNKANDAATKIHNELINIANLLDKFRTCIEILEPEDALKLVTTEDEDAMLKNKDKNQDTIEKHRKKLAPLCNLIIEEVANIKTRDIKTRDIG